MVMLDIDDELIVVKQSEQIYMYHKWHGIGFITQSFTDN